MNYLFFLITGIERGTFAPPDACYNRGTPILKREGVWDIIKKKKNRRISNGENMDSIGLYIHVPFCKSKCGYCDFNSYAGKEDMIPAYFDALSREVGIYSVKLKNAHIDTIYIGGGTPSYVDAKYIYNILNICRQSFSIAKGAEVTIESNPGTLSFEKLLAYKTIGINRLSIGLQACQNRILRRIGRIHSMEEFEENYSAARKAGFKNINVDLMFGLPGQEMRDWAESLAKVAKLGAEHISCYGLNIEAGTPIASYIESDPECLPGEDDDREMYGLAIDKLSRKGYVHYEISNFARKGFECRHNLMYWDCGRYIGLGAGAHSYFEGKRYSNVREIEKYTDSLLMRNTAPVDGAEEIDGKTQMSEFMILGLRKVEGVLKEEFEKRFGKEITEEYGEGIARVIRAGLLEDTGCGFRLTRRGLNLANEVLIEFIKSS